MVCEVVGNPLHIQANGLQFFNQSFVGCRVKCFKSKNTAAAPLPDSIISSQSFVVIYVSVKSAFIVVFI